MNIVMRHIYIEVLKNNRWIGLEYFKDIGLWSVVVKRGYWDDEIGVL